MTKEQALAKSILMQVLINCENQLGWVPKGKDLHKARAAQHHIMSKILATKRVSEEDLAIAVAWCRSRRYPISDPMQLFALVDKAKERAAEKGPRAGSLDARRQEAVAWEFALSDPRSPHWINRLTRSVGDGLADTLTDWLNAGRGQQLEAA